MTSATEQLVNLIFRVAAPRWDGVHGEFSQLVTIFYEYKLNGDSDKHPFHPGTG